jgi:hypothetical protein
MAGAFWYGGLLGVLSVVLTRGLAGETGWAVWWAVVAVQLAIAAAVTWRRTRLALSTTAMALGSIFSVGVVVAAAGGRGWPALLRDDWHLLVPCLLVAPLLLLAESRLHREQWRHWRAHMTTCSLLDVLALRHIPDWRGTRARHPVRDA